MQRRGQVVPLRRVYARVEQADVEAAGDHIRVLVNGVPAADVVDSLDLTGSIALQVHAYKGPPPVEVRWRNIRIQDLGRHTWKPLFDGQTPNGWPASGGLRRVAGNGRSEKAPSTGSKPDDERIGFLISDSSLKDVTARLKFRILTGNSGFFLRSDQATLAGYEVEIDVEERTGGFWEVRGCNWVTGPEDN
jgi:hypothetical protein